MSFDIAKYSFVKDEQQAQEFYQKGYLIIDLPNIDLIEQVKRVFDKHHSLQTNGGATFFTVFSKDKQYRKDVHEELGQILQGVFRHWFINYKSMANAFVVKTPGEFGRVPIHQDLAAIDEEQFSSINVWLPLVDITTENGGLWLIPGSHHIYDPYRCASTPPIQSNFETHLYPYFQPIYLKQGQVLLFDARLFHFSEPNISGENRVVSVSRICPIQADVLTFTYHPQINDKQVLQWHCPEDFLLTSEVYGAEAEPEKGIFLNHKPYTNPLSETEFKQRLTQLDIKPVNQEAMYDCPNPSFIFEPKQ